jgi:hypothetical protein
MGKYIHGFGILLEFFFVVLFFRSANLVMGGGAWIPWEFPFCLLNFFFFFLSVGFAFVLAGIVECALRVFENFIFW